MIWCRRATCAAPYYGASALACWLVSFVSPIGDAHHVRWIPPCLQRAVVATCGPSGRAGAGCGHLQGRSATIPTCGAEHRSRSHRSRRSRRSRSYSNSSSHSGSYRSHRSHRSRSCSHSSSNSGSRLRRCLSTCSRRHQCRYHRSDPTRRIISSSRTCRCSRRACRTCRCSSNHSKPHHSRPVCRHGCRSCRSYRSYRLCRLCRSCRRLSSSSSSTSSNSSTSRSCSRSRLTRSLSSSSSTPPPPPRRRAWCRSCCSGAISSCEIWALSTWAARSPAGSPRSRRRAAPGLAQGRGLGDRANLKPNPNPHPYP